MKSANSFSLSGRLTADANIFSSKYGKVARFSVAHNFDKYQPALFMDAVMFAKKDEELPENLLKKGTVVIINGFFRASSTTKDGKTYRNTDMVVTSIEAIQDDEAGE